MEQLETKEERYFKKCVDESKYEDEEGRNWVRIGDAVKQLERMYPKTDFALIRRRSDTKWIHLMIPAFYVETYVREHNYEDKDDWFSVVGSYRSLKKEQKHLMEMNINA